jgi:hypothetical protein
MGIESAPAVLAHVATEDAELVTVARDLCTVAGLATVAREHSLGARLVDQAAAVLEVRVAQPRPSPQRWPLRFDTPRP